MWTRNPIPACKFCNQAECMTNYSDWLEQQHCSQSCSGLNISGHTCPPGMAQFEPAGHSLSGYYSSKCIDVHGESECDGLHRFQYSIVDKVQIPKAIPAGKYLLSWRWDCEQSRQIWQNCADIQLI
eukprot:m.477415 g.477415  ORF g.477415 m.477415 type:complete len:126 (-) comp43590_c0_seq1:50-427(-)